MNSTNPASQHPLLFCIRCDKPFVNGISSVLQIELTTNHRLESAHKRHLRYCGSRARTRPRSCRACNAAKVKCSFETPCSRCSKKNIECVYGSPSTPRQATADSEERFELSHSQSVDQVLGDASSNIDFSFVDALSWDVASTTQRKDVPILDLDTQSPMFLDFLSTGHAFAVGSLSVDELNPARNASEPPAWCAWSMGDSSLTVLKDTSLTHAEDALPLSKNHATSHAQHVVQLIAQSLRAIPTMMLRRQTFPAFVHRRSKHARGDAQSDLPTAITACMSLAHVFAVDTSETRSFLWPAIRKEYTHFLEQVSVEPIHNLCTSFPLAWHHPAFSSEIDMA